MENNNNFSTKCVPDICQMSFSEYQSRAMQTCMSTCDNISYMLLNLVGEIGEFTSKIAKCIRKGEATIINNNFIVEVPYSETLGYDFSALRKEAGDCLWQIAGLCTAMGWSLEEVAQENLQKLADRQKRNVIDGSGDNR